MSTSTPAAHGGLLRRFTATTPGRFRLFRALCVIGVLAWLAAAVATQRDLTRSTDRVRTESGPVLIATQQLFSSLAEADAAATAEHLAGRADGREQRGLYEEALARAARQIDVIASRIGDDDDAHAQLQNLLVALNRYAGGIETAREKRAADAADANAALVAALGISSTQLTPNVSALLAGTTERIDDDSQSTNLTVVAVLALGALVATQYVFTKSTRRLVNVPLALATLAVIAAMVWLGLAASGQRSDVADARSIGANSIGLIAMIQSTGYEAKTAQSLALIDPSQTTEQLLRAESASDLLLDSSLTAAAIVDQIASGDPEMPEGGLLTDAVSVADTDRERASVSEVLIRWQRYRDTAGRIRSELNGAGGVESARQLATDAGSSDFNGFNLSVESFLTDNRAQFEQRLEAADDRLRGLGVAMVAGPLAALALALWGIRIRLDEYR